MVYNYTIDQVPIEMELMSDSSRVWIFQSQKSLSDKEVMQVNEYLRLFTQSWTAHNRELQAHAGVFYNRFVIVMLDEEQSNSASGCSIDNLTRHVQNIGDQLDTNVMVRDEFGYIDAAGQVRTVHMNALSAAYAAGEITDDTLFFDTLVKTKGDLFSKWLKPLKNSWHYRFTR